jgi:aldehyde:ferredoxin oxidoreductase
MSEFAYAGKMIKVDLSTRQTEVFSSAEFTRRFLGGRGVGAKLYWDLTPPGISAFDPANSLSFVTGPVTGFMRFSGCRWQICGKSPQIGPGFFSFANVGGAWGAWLKYAGYDAVTVTGRSENPVYLYIDNQGKVEIRDASYLWGQNNTDSIDMLQAELGKDVKIFTIGTAAENQVYFSLGMTSDHALAGGGLMSVIGSKKLKAVIVKADGRHKPPAAHPEQLPSLAKLVYDLKENNWDPYPEFEANGIYTPCFGCMGGPGFCNRRTYKAECGRLYRAFCQSTMVYVAQAQNYAVEGAPSVYHLATQLCDNFGLDSMVLRPMIDWLGACFQGGILTESETGLPLSKIGSLDFINTLVRKISRREGFGDILANGTIRAAESVGKGSHTYFGQVGVLTRDGQTNDYDPRMFFTNAMVNATEPRKAIHLLHSTAMPVRRWVEWYQKKENCRLSTEILQRIAQQWWGSVAAADFTSYTGKALAAKKIQDYGYAKESLILCDLMWPIHQVRTYDPDITCGTLESRILSAITGQDWDEQGLLDMGEKIFNLQRMALLRDGWPGRRGDTILDYLFEEPLQEVYWSAECLVPDKVGRVVSRKGVVIDRNEFEKMKSEYYSLRGWDNEGYPTRARLVELGLGDITPLEVKA